MEANGILNGLEQALVKGEELARDKTKSEPPTETDGEARSEKLRETSKRLACILLLSLESTEGPQYSIAVNRRWGEECDGIKMWADLIRHFERGSTELRKLDLRRDWENCTIKLREHPSEFYGRLIALNSKMESMSTGCSNEDTQMRFVTSLEGEESGIYKNTILQYRGTIISMTTWSMSSLLEFVTHVYETSQVTMRPQQQMNGLFTNEIKCDHCHKFGHVKKSCRYLKPRPMNKRNNYKITCYTCGKPVHMIRDCKEKNKNEVISMLSLNNNEDDCIDCYYKTTFIDS